MDETNLGPLKIRFLGSILANAVPISGGESTLANQHLALITGPDGIALEVAYLEFENGSRDVRVLETGDTPNPYLRLGHGGRLGIYAIDNELYCELRAMKLDADNWSNLQRATTGELFSWLGEDPNKVLSEAGCSSVQTRSALFMDEGRRRNELAVKFSVDNKRAPVLIYALTRPLPLLRGAQKN